MPRHSRAELNNTMPTSGAAADCLLSPSAPHCDCEPLLPQQDLVDLTAAGLAQHSQAGFVACCLTQLAQVGLVATTVAVESADDFDRAARATKNSGGETLFFSAQANFSWSVWQQHLSQQKAAVEQPQGQFSQGKRSVTCLFTNLGSGMPTIQNSNTGSIAAATSRVLRTGAYSHDLSFQCFTLASFPMEMPAPYRRQMISSLADFSKQNELLAAAAFFHSRMWRRK